jgi:hypothetical protein
VSASSHAFKSAAEDQQNFVCHIDLSADFSYELMCKIGNICKDDYIDDGYLAKESCGKLVPKC